MDEHTKPLINCHYKGSSYSIIVQNSDNFNFIIAMLYILRAFYEFYMTIVNL